MEEKLDKYKLHRLELVYNNKILVVSLNRPPVNALIQESYEELSSIIQDVNNDLEVCALVLRSDATVFCAGGDIKQVAKSTPQEGIVRRTWLRKSMTDLANCSVPVICAVNGAATGAGAVMAASGDIIFASESAFFSVPEIDVGMVGGAKGLSKILHPQKIRTLALTGLRCSAEDAYRLGGVEAVVPLSELDEKAMSYARIIADKGYMSVRKWKEALLFSETVGAREGVLIESNFNNEMIISKLELALKKANEVNS